MIQKYVFGTPFFTGAVTEDINRSEGAFPHGTISTDSGFCFTYGMDADDIIYGLGEANRGINKRNWRYVSDCADDPNHTEDRCSLYAAHNFIIIAGTENFGLFFDHPPRSHLTSVIPDRIRSL